MAESASLELILFVTVAEMQLLFLHV